MTEDFYVIARDALRLKLAVLARAKFYPQLAQQIKNVLKLLSVAKTVGELEVCCSLLRSIFKSMLEPENYDVVLDTPQSCRTAGVRRSNEMRGYGDGNGPGTVVDNTDERSQSLSTSDMGSYGANPNSSSLDGGWYSSNVARPLPDQPQQRRTYRPRTKRKFILKSDEPS